MHGDRKIAHLDMDAFFAAIEERDRPRLRGLPIVVGADPRGGTGRGVVSTANYKAREYGIHSAMPISKAWQLAQSGKQRGGAETIFLGSSFSKYAKVSQEIMKTIQHYSSIIEQASVDEAYVDLSYCASWDNAEAICRELKDRIVSEHNLTASIGLGANRLIAKIASDMQKPNGLTIVYPEHSEAFLADLPIRKIPGVGPKSAHLLSRYGVEYIRDVTKFSLEHLQSMLGKMGESLYYKSRGIDTTPVGEQWETKSIGEQETFARDTRDGGIIIECIQSMSKRIIGNLRKEGFSSFRSIMIIIRFSDFVTKTKVHSIAEPLLSADQLEFEACRLILPFLDHRENPRKKPIRLVGVRVGKLS